MKSIDDLKEWGDCHTEQIGEFDCGPACVNIIRNHFFGGSEYREELKKIELKESGISLAEVSKLLGNAGARTLGVKVNYGKMVDDFTFPLISHINGNHFIVVWDATNENICISDPAEKSIKIMNKDDFCENWDGVCLLID